MLLPTPNVASRPPHSADRQAPTLSPSSVPVGRRQHPPYLPTAPVRRRSTIAAPGWSARPPSTFDSGSARERDRESVEGEEREGVCCERREKRREREKKKREREERREKKERENAVRGGRERERRESML